MAPGMQSNQAPVQGEPPRLQRPRAAPGLARQEALQRQAGLPGRAGSHRWACSGRAGVVAASACQAARPRLSQPRRGVGNLREGDAWASPM
eukprot:4830319-Alexandrium_andersonii.AAC.1